MRKIMSIFFIAFTLVLLVGCKDNSSKVSATISELTYEIKTMSFILIIQDDQNEITGNISIELKVKATGAVISTRTTTKENMISNSQTFDYVNLTASTEYTLTVRAVTGRKSVTLTSTTFTTKDEDNVITTVEQFMAIASNRTGNYVLANDLDFSEVDFSPMFITATNGFAGTFEGNGFELQNITFKSIEAYTGIFGNISTGKISNLVLRNVSIGTEEAPLAINRAARVGLLSGYVSANTSEITNIEVYDSRIYVSSSSTINFYVGGLIGESLLGAIENITMDGVDVVVTSTSTGTIKVGGVVGFMSDTSNFTRPRLSNVMSNTNVAFHLENARNVDKAFSIVVGGVVGDNNAQQSNRSIKDVFHSGNILVNLDFNTQEGVSRFSYTLNVGGIVGRSYSNLQSIIFAGSIEVNHEANEFEEIISKTFNIGGLVGFYDFRHTERISNELLRLGDGQTIHINVSEDVTVRASQGIARVHIDSVVHARLFGDLHLMINDVSLTDQDPTVMLDDLEDYFQSTWLEEAYLAFINR